MCDRGTPVRQRAMCGCYSRRAVAAGVTVAVVVVLAWFGLLEAVVIGSCLVGAALAGFTAWHLFRADGFWLVHRTTQPPVRAAAEAEPAPEVPWWERAQFSRGRATTAGTRATLSPPPATARTPQRSIPPGAGVPSQDHLPPRVQELAG